jgi:hypothetical protein
MRPPRFGHVLALATMAGVALSACSKSGSPASFHRIPPAPSDPVRSVEPGQPPTIWIGGTLSDVASASLAIREPTGAEVSLRRLAAGATAFFQVANGSWHRLAPEAQISAGRQACVEVLMDGANLLALRVFLGVACGPS